MASPQRHLLLAVFVKIVFAFPSGKDIKYCGVNYNQEVKIRAMRFDIGVWVPKEREDSILKLTMKFEKLEELIYHDTIELSRNKYRVTRRRGLHEKSQNESELSWEVAEGWGTFRVDITNQYRLFYETLNGSKLLLEETCNMTLRSLKIEGSDVTLDCPEKLRTWEVAEEPAVIPLDKSKQHRITLYSTKDIYSSIKLGSKEYPLRWSNQTISSIEGKGPLPKFISHNVTTGCESGNHEVVCFMKDKTSGKLLERVTLPEFPDHLIVIRNEGYAFTTILHLQNYSSEEKHPSGEGAAACGDDATDKESHFEMTIIITLLITNLATGGGIVYLCIKNSKLGSRGTRTEEHGQDGSEAETRRLETSAEQNELFDPIDMPETKDALSEIRAFTLTTPYEDII